MTYNVHNPWEHHTRLLSMWTAPLQAFRLQLMQLIEVRFGEFKESPTSMHLPGLESHWRRTGEPRTAASFVDDVLTQVRGKLENLHADTSALDVRAALLQMYRTSRRAGPEWMQACAFNELIDQAVNALHCLTQDVYAGARQRTPPESLLPSQAAVRHRHTNDIAMVQGVQHFDASGLQYTVLGPGSGIYQRWDADVVEPA